jgi:uncharacterized protein YciI
MKQAILAGIGKLAALALAGVGTAAGAAGLPADQSLTMGTEDRSYIFSYLVLDQPEQLGREEMAEAMQGHFDNMTRMAEAGDLLIAGPLADPRIDETYRGIFVFSTAEADKAQSLVATDPSVEAGVFKPEMYTITCDEPLNELLRLEKEYEQRRLEDPEIPDEWVGRMFVLTIGPDDAAFEDTDAVLIDATMARIDDDSDEVRQLLWLDAINVEEARSKFKAADPEEWSFYGWYGSPCVAELNNQELRP